MKRHHYGMLFGCLALIALIYFAPMLGLAGSVTSVLVILLMFGCCLLPLLMGFFMGRDASCHHSGTDNKTDNRGQPESEKKSPSCH
jgi:hypothetical protein